MFHRKKDEREQAIENAQNKYSQIIKTFLQNMESLDTYYQNEDLNEQDIIQKKKNFLEGSIEVIRKDLYFDWVFSQFSKELRNDNVKLPVSPSIYPKDFSEGNCVILDDQVLLNKCIFINLRKSYSISNQIDRIVNNEGLDGRTYYFYKNLKLGIPAGDGNHRIAAASMKDYPIKGKLYVYDDTKAIESLTTDGYYWYYNKEEIAEIFDYRIAIIFSLTKKLLSM